MDKRHIITVELFNKSTNRGTKTSIILDGDESIIDWLENKKWTSMNAYSIAGNARYYDSYILLNVHTEEVPCNDV